MTAQSFLSPSFYSTFIKTRLNSSSVAPTLIVLTSLLLSACESDPTLGNALGTDDVTGVQQPIPKNPSDPDVPLPSGSTAQIGDTCQSNDPKQICLSLRYVTYENSQGVPVNTEEEVLDNLEVINQIWSQCGIAFEIGQFEIVRPGDYSLNYNTSSSSELTQIRRTFASKDKLLVVTTGTWSGSLGAGSANAWTAMPGSSALGAIHEATVADYPNIIAHELGHYLNLDHSSDSSNVLSAIIYQGSKRLTTSQCNQAKSAVNYYWLTMLR